MSEETQVTVKFWAVIVVIIAAISWLSMTAFAHRERIVTLEATTAYMQRSTNEIKESINEIKCDLKEHIKDTRERKK